MDGDHRAEPLLARVAGQLLAVHRPDPTNPERCARCRRRYPCGTAAVAGEAARQAAGEDVLTAAGSRS